MRILIVEDDAYKYTQIANLVTSLHPSAEISHFNSVHGARKFLKGELPDKMILDMSLPTHPPIAGEGSPVSMGAGGVEVLLALRRQQKYDLPIAILTQYIDFEIEDDYYTLEEAPGAIERFYGLKNVIAVLYEHGSTNWENLLRNFLEN
jgi:CheY-like chemotaxis protein